MSGEQQEPYPQSVPYPGAAPNYPPPAGYGAYPPAYGYGYAPQPPTNTLAILALVFAFVFAPAAIVLGAVARKQIRRTGERGLGLATSGFVIGIVFTVLWVIWFVAVVVFIHAMQSHAYPN